MELHHALDKDSRVVLLHAACHQRIEQRMLRAYTSMMVFARGRKNHPEVRGGQRRRTLVFAACGISVARNADGRRQRQSSCHMELSSSVGMRSPGIGMRCY